MKILKKHEVAKLEFRETRQGGFGTKYDWTTFLSGQDIVLTAGEDYPTDADPDKAKQKQGQFVMMLRQQGYATGKSVDVKYLADGTGILIKATEMTDVEKVARENDRKERSEQAKARIAAKKAGEANGSQPHPEPAEAVSPE